MEQAFITNVLSYISSSTCGMSVDSSIKYCLFHRHAPWDNLRHEPSSYSAFTLITHLRAFHCGVSSHHTFSMHHSNSQISGCKCSAKKTKNENQYFASVFFVIRSSPSLYT
ncbi:unnamed protein product [Orchesella dallaii]|uniref:Uncharacterized protein n=1 Tax=Orchesella dallaii TaxID=48710 RepID=A0ABP1PQ36_9HEXA